MGVFDRLRSRLGRTRTALADGVSGLFRGGREIDAALLDELEEILYNADLGVVASELVEDLKRGHRRGELHGESDVRAALRRALLERLPTEWGEIPFEANPTVILVVGVNGSGKTTSIAKLAHRFHEQGKHAEAEILYRQALDVARRALGVHACGPFVVSECSEWSVLPNPATINVLFPRKVVNKIDTVKEGNYNANRNKNNYPSHSNPTNPFYNILVIYIKF